MMDRFARNVRLGVIAVCSVTAAYAAAGMASGQSAFRVVHVPVGLTACGTLENPCQMDPLVVAAELPLEAPASTRIRMVDAGPGETQTEGRPAARS